MCKYIKGETREVKEGSFEFFYPKNYFETNIYCLTFEDFFF